MKEELWHVLWVVGPVTQAIKLHFLCRAQLLSRV